MPAHIIPGRPDRPITFRCAYESTTRRVTFPSAQTTRFESLRNRVEECFHLSASPFYFTYTDDDGEEFAIRTDTDLTEAIAYFVSGDDHAGSVYSNTGSITRVPSQKITVRLDVAVEYDGPSLSDVSSIISGRSGHGSYENASQHSWLSSTQSSAYTAHSRGSGDVIGVIEEEVESSSRSGATSSTQGENPIARQLNGLSLNPALPVPEDREGASIREPPILTGPESDPAPPLLTHSELGSRWLREQSRLARRQAPRSRVNGSGRRYGSDEESFGSDDESPGVIALQRNAKGRYYYSYSTEDSSTESISDGDVDDPFSTSRVLTPSASTSSPPDSAFSSEPVRVAEPTGPPSLAPDCSACGVRLEYIRYVCSTCGEGQMWKENAPGKSPFVPRTPPVLSISDGSEGSTETDGTGNDSTGSRTVYQTTAQPRQRSNSLSTQASHSPPGSDAGDLSQPVGYELCSTCIETHGVVHAKAASKAGSLNGSRLRSGTKLRHTFREKIWTAAGWSDVEYNEDSECTMCRTPLITNRFKCVSCPKFDLCRSCHQKVGEIHPAHVFLSLPDKSLPNAESSTSYPPQVDIRNQDPVNVASSKLVRHPGAFCHNCLQDIVGPRFHCAVCPSWDLCIQCEGVVTVGHGGHTADHIMMKIPLPLASSEVEAVSRRARDRWFQQDSSAVAAQRSDSTTSTSSRSPSPTNETVYGGISNNVMDRNGLNGLNGNEGRSSARDVLDHGCRCSNCNEWILGRRYQCANCPSELTAFNLCSICELRSYRVHDPFHVFFKFDRPVHFPLTSPRPLLPRLYKSRVGDVPSGSVLDPHDPTSYLRHLVHKETLCDIHSDQIRGIWLRCAHCAAGFDMCQEAEGNADHDPTHVFVVFKARVDMAAFRILCDLGARHSKPLLTQRVYLS
ncbi:hypothetical protein M231_05589 [Tremella mesenterica]|uniref:ZZ-type domain-containing protein n=1 Tax=Tremella mesenterica TaxID=5217 RepID=A0A4Q1BHP3_TREME|nr:hypothetical protein M231_05589 [Tremella mesenterica]